MTAKEERQTKRECDGIITKIAKEMDFRLYIYSPEFPADRLQGLKQFQTFMGKIVVKSHHFRQHKKMIRKNLVHPFSSKEWGKHRAHPSNYGEEMILVMGTHCLYNPSNRKLGKKGERQSPFWKLRCTGKKLIKNVKEIEKLK
jgi:hypothetical protein